MDDQRQSTERFNWPKWESKTCKQTRVNQRRNLRQVHTRGRGQQSCPKVLGLLWDYGNDEICFDLATIVAKAQEIRPTKRNVLSVLASMFDPLGIIRPVFVCMKMLFQELCYDSIAWDD